MKEHFLTLLRQRETDTASFRMAARRLGDLIALEAASHLPLHRRKIHTPLAQTDGAFVENKVILVPILRAGLALLPPFVALFPQASIGFLGIRRDEKDASPHLYYENLPKIAPNAAVFLLDPMLATGGTANLALDHLIRIGADPAHTLLVTFLASVPGLAELRKRHPRVRVVYAAVDPELDSKKFIIPGLGDFGDRYFG